MQTKFYNIRAIMYDLSKTNVTRSRPKTPQGRADFYMKDVEKYRQNNTNILTILHDVSPRVDHNDMIKRKLM